MSDSTTTATSGDGGASSSRWIALAAVIVIAMHLAMRFGWPEQSGETLPVIGAFHNLPLLVLLTTCGARLVVSLLVKAFRAEFSSDLLAGISIVTSVVLGEFLAGALVVLMLSGGQALEAFAVRSASSVLAALAKRMPSVAHRKTQGGAMQDVALDAVAVGDTLVILPHETCPVDGVVVEGRGSMDEAYLTGEPYLMSKTPGSTVLSGAINGVSALTIRAEKRAEDSRYAKIMHVMRESEQRRPKLRRLGDALGAWYTPLAVGIALVAWLATGEAHRFLAVLVVATPCPLLIAIPVAIIGSVSLSARRGIIIKDPAVLERLDTCRTAMFDKTGTLTYGQPRLTQIVAADGFTRDGILALAASVERYSRHPLALAVGEEARAAGVAPSDAEEVSEKPGAGLRGRVGGREVLITSRAKLGAMSPGVSLPPVEPGMEAVVVIDGRFAALLRFRDEPRAESRSFIGHLHRKHGMGRVLLISGDREAEVRHLAERVGITQVYASQSPEEKLALVRRETQAGPTIFLGDGINDAPALAAATVGVAFGQGSDVTSEAAAAVVLDSSLERVDELMHIARRTRAIALQSAVGGMALSVLGMALAAAGVLSPVAGAIAQEVIDVLAVANALRAALPPRSLSDY